VFGGVHLGKAGGKIRAHQVELSQLPIVQIVEGGVLVAGLLTNQVPDPGPEEVALVEAKILDHPLGVADDTPGVIEEVVEVQLLQDLLGFLQRIAQGEQDSVDGAGRGTAHALDVLEDLALVECLERTDVGDAFDASAFEDEVSEGVRHGGLLGQAGGGRGRVLLKREFGVPGRFGTRNVFI
jgi:hypothetical protein